MNITDKRAQITEEARPTALSLTYYYLYLKPRLYNWRLAAFMILQ